MNEIDARLEEREKEGKPITVGLIGAGQMGTEIVTQIGEMVGMRVAVVVDFTEGTARAGYAYAKRTTEIAMTNDVNEAAAALSAGKQVAATDFRVATRLPVVDVVIDATGSIEMGAIATLDAIDHRKHVVMMSVETDITIGPILHRLARNAGLVYSLAGGDEPAAIIELYRFARSLGFTIIAAGKGKNNPLNVYSTPETEKQRAVERGMSPKMLCEFVDGSKTAIEMAAVSNATGLVPDVRGMHAAHASVAELNRVFVPKGEGGVLERRGVVDFAVGVHPGVFVVVTTDNKRIREGLVQRDMGNGPYYTLYRPFHLCSIEVPLTVANAVIYGESAGYPRAGLVSECFAIAKRDIEKGETLDSIGEFCYRGSIDLASTARAERLLPLGLAKGCIMKNPVGMDAPITYDDVVSIPESVVLQLRRIQDALYNTPEG